MINSGGDGKSDSLFNLIGRPQQSFEGRVQRSLPGQFFVYSRLGQGVQIRVLEPSHRRHFVEDVSASPRRVFQ